MTIRRRVVSKPAEPPPPTKGQVANSDKAMRRVWRAGKTGRYDPHWYVEAFTREGAINYIARQFKEPASHFDGE